MGIFGKLLQTAGENLTKSKEEREAEVRFIQENRGSIAISSYIASLFEKGMPGYNWVKQNRIGLYPIINDDSFHFTLLYADGRWTVILRNEA